MIIIFRTVNTTVCDPEDYWGDTGELGGLVQERWHPHKKINQQSYRAPIHPAVSRKHRRNLKVLD